jgi:hypothetical protein
MRLLSLAVASALAASCQPTATPPGDPGSSGAQGGSTAATGGASTAGSGGSLPSSGGTGGAAAGAGMGGTTGGMAVGGGGGQPPVGGGGVGGASTAGMAGGGAPPLGGSGGSTAGSSVGGAGAGAQGGATDAGAGGASAGTGGTTAGLGCTGSELLCEDFEDVADGMVPTGAPWQPLDASCSFQTGSFTMGVTGTLANGGMKSLKVTNKHFAQCRLSGAFQAVDEFWVRAYSYWETALDISNRETLDIDLTPGFRTAYDPAVRFGYRSKAPCEEYAGPQITIIGLAGGEATGCGSRAMPKGEWFCFEAHVQQTTNLVVSTFVNGEALTYQSTGKAATPSISTESAISQKVDHIRLGIFSTGEAQGSIYLDDIAVATTRIGCVN